MTNQQNIFSRKPQNGQHCINNKSFFFLNVDNVKGYVVSLVTDGERSRGGGGVCVGGGLVA